MNEMEEKAKEYAASVGKLITKQSLHDAMKIELSKGRIDALADKWFFEHGYDCVGMEVQKEIFICGYIECVKDMFGDLDVVIR